MADDPTPEYTFKRYRAPLVYSTVLDVLENGVVVCQAVHSDDSDGIIVGFSRDGGHKWYGYHKSTATSLDEFQARFERQDA